MRQVRTFVFIVGLLIFPAGSAWGVATPTAIDRTVAYSTETQSDLKSSSSPGLFDENISAGEALAFQISEILALSFGGSAGAVASSDDAASALSSFDVIFELTVPHPFTLEGSVQSSKSFGGTTHSEFLLFGAGTDLFFQAFDNADPTSFSEVGTLAPGVYHLKVTGDASVIENTSAFAEAFWQFALELTDPTAAVPEPFTPVLLALGAGVLAWRGIAQRRPPSG